MHKLPCLFDDIPSQTDWIEHYIDVGDARPIKQQFYRMAPGKRDYLEAEVAYMLQNNIAAPYYRPVGLLHAFSCQNRMAHLGLVLTYER